MRRMLHSIFFLLICRFPAGRGKITPSQTFFLLLLIIIELLFQARQIQSLICIECAALKEKGQNVPKSHNSFGVFWFWCWCYFFFYFNVLMSCQIQFSGFWHRHIQKLSHYSFISTVFSLLPLSGILTCLATTAPLGVPVCLPGDRCPDFSHDRSVPCRFEEHILPLFKVTDCCIPNSPL